jgi:hypothetical protein
MGSTRRQLMIGFVALSAVGVAAVAVTAERRPRVASAGTASPAAAPAGLDGDDALRSERAWRQAYAAARRTRGWNALVAVADAHGRLAAEAQRAVRPQLRELYLEVLTRARAQGSLDGVLRAGEGFVALGDRGAAAQALRVARGMAPGRADADTLARLRSLAERS